MSQQSLLSSLLPSCCQNLAFGLGSMQWNSKPTVEKDMQAAAILPLPWEVECYTNYDITCISGSCFDCLIILNSLL